jgi:hypothetical protein
MFVVIFTALFVSIHLWGAFCPRLFYLGNNYLFNTPQNNTNPMIANKIVAATPPIPLRLSCQFG